jgi:hypothetical protein
LLPVPAGAWDSQIQWRKDMRIRIRSILVALAVVCGTFALASCDYVPASLRSQTRSDSQRPSYQIDATIDYDLLTFRGSALVMVPASARDPLPDAAFFLYANAAGIVDDQRRKYIVVDGVSLGHDPVPFNLSGSVLHVGLGEPQVKPFPLRVVFHGVIPRSAGSASGGGLMGGVSPASLGNLGGLLGTAGADGKRANNDFGLYSYSDGILSLGSFWYPQLAVRRNGKWVDEEPKGLGDVTYAEMSDFDVTLTLPAGLKVVTSGDAPNDPEPGSSGSQKYRYLARNVRDFAVLMSEDYVSKSKTVEAGGKSILVEAHATRQHEGYLDKVLDFSVQALRLYSDRFGPYPYGSFKAAEGTVRGGAGGMEFSGLTSLAPMLFVDWNKQIREISGLLGGTGLDQLLGGLSGTKPGDPARNQVPDAAGRGSLGSFMNLFLGQQTDLLGSLMEMTVAHEVAHQWWAIGVGSDSVREPFVDESLTNYCAVLYFEDRYGRATAEKIIQMHLKMPYSMGRMLGETDAPVNLPTSAYAGGLQYSAVVYGKGALYYGALRRAVGDPVFFSSLREYYARYRGKVAGPRAMLEIVQAKAPSAGVEGLYRHWIEETHGDEDITGGPVAGLQDLLNELLRKLGGLDTGTSKKP